MPIPDPLTPACYFCLRLKHPKEQLVYVKSRSGEDAFLCCPECAALAKTNEEEFHTIVEKYQGSERVKRVRNLFEKDT